MALGKTAPDWYHRRVYFKHSLGNSRGWRVRSVLQAGFNRHRRRSSPKDSAFFPGCACARRGMIARCVRFAR